MVTSETTASDGTPLLLILDTTSQFLGIALGDRFGVSAEWGLSVSGPGASQVLPDVDYLLKRAGVRPADLAAVGVVTGPGSFTGLRVGLATAQGIAQALNLPVVTATALEVVAHALPPLPPDAGICVIRSAYRDEIYAQVFTDDLEPVTEPLAGNRTALVSRLIAEALPFPRRLVFTGDAVPDLAAIIGDEAARRGVAFHSEGIRLGAATGETDWWYVPAPRYLAAAGLPLFRDRFDAGLALSALEAEPCYARASEAERKLGGPA